MHRARSIYCALVTLAVVAAGVTAVDAYTVITVDGHRFEAVEKPEIKGTQAYMRLFPHGQFASIKEEQIDWKRTGAANREPQPIAIRSNEKLVEGPAQVPPHRVTTIVGEREAPKPELAKEERNLESQEKTLKDLQAELERFENQGVTQAGNSVDAGKVRDLKEMINVVEGNIRQTRARIEALKEMIAALEVKPPVE